MRAAAVLTVSDGVARRRARGSRAATVLAELLAGEGYEVERRVVPDERDAIAERARELAAIGRGSSSRPAARASRRAT